MCLANCHRVGMDRRNGQPWCGYEECCADIDRRIGVSVRPMQQTSVPASTRPPTQSFRTNTQVCGIQGCGHTCSDYSSICDGYACKLATNLIQQDARMDVPDGTCWACKQELGRAGCTDDRHKRIFKFLRNKGLIRVISRISAQSPTNFNRCPGHIISMPANGFSGPTFVTPAMGPTSSSAQRVRINGVGDMMIARNPIAQVPMFDRMIIHDPNQALAFAQARGMNPGETIFRLQRNSYY
jgi:hypothetical protein